jgi:hypothetical protein
VTFVQVTLLVAAVSLIPRAVPTAAAGTLVVSELRSE